MEARSAFAAGPEKHVVTVAIHLVGDAQAARAGTPPELNLIQLATPYALLLAL